MTVRSPAKAAPSFSAGRPGRTGVDSATTARDKRAAGSNRTAGPRVAGSCVDLTGVPSARFRGGGVETGLEDPTIAWDRP